MPPCLPTALQLASMALLILLLYRALYLMSSCCSPLLTNYQMQTKQNLSPPSITACALILYTCTVQATPLQNQRRRKTRIKTTCTVHSIVIVLYSTCSNSQENWEICHHTVRQIL